MTDPIGIPMQPEPDETPTVTPPVEQPPVDAVLAKLMERIKPIDEAPMFFKALIYGPPGAGKTTFAGAADGSLVIDIERGTRSLRNHPESKHALVMEYRSTAQVEATIAAIGDGKLPNVKTLVLDSVTALQSADLDGIVQKAAKEDSNRNLYVPQLQDYNANTNHMRRIGSMLRDLQCNVVCIAQLKEVKDESTGRLLLRPNLTDKLALSFNHLFDTVGYLTVDPEGNRMLQLALSDKVIAKTRIGGLPAVIKNPSINDLIAANNSTKDN